MVVVNSKFTQDAFAKSFKSIKAVPDILYPGISLEAYDKEFDAQDVDVKSLQT